MKVPVEFPKRRSGVSGERSCPATRGRLCVFIVALDETHSSAVFGWLGFLFCEAAIGVGECDERDQSAPAQTASRAAGFGSN